ncbi:MAG: phosphotransferase enzyme family protein [Pseudomonadales bacterium]
MKPPSNATAHAVMEQAWWRVDSCAPLGNGHIHNTWLVTGGHGRAVLQQISTAVFRDPAALMLRVTAVLAHLGRQVGHTDILLPELIPTRQGSSWHAASDGTHWRLWTYISDAITLETLSTPEQAEAAGQAFGQLQAALADAILPAPDPIPGFMQLDHYLSHLDAIAAAASTQSAQERELLQGIHARRNLAGRFSQREQVIHGDCKVNNLLFARGTTNAVRAVLDLDTVMHGHWAWDAGDLVRSAAAGPNGFALDRFAGVVRGFRTSASISAEPEVWVLAPRYVTLMLVVRFLTDHLEGDRYFRVTRRGENLNRAIAQWRLLLEMEQVADAMQATIQ